jgi:TusA-related sulfurtransferase
MESLKYDRFLDLKGLECPLPVVRSREEIARMVVGQILKVVATDSDSLTNFQAWTNTAKNVILVAQAIDGRDGDVWFSHYIRKIQ